MQCNLSKYWWERVNAGALSTSKYFPVQIGRIPQGSTVQELLQTPVWQETLRYARNYSQAFPILAPENLDHMALFASGQVHVAQGRKFTWEEYRDGAPVCLISESLAEANGLQVGDVLPFSLYPVDNIDYLGKELNDEEIVSHYDTHQTIPLIYNMDMDPEGSQEEVCTIVGLYRQNNEWSGNQRYFTPNTILVPSSLVKVKMLEGNDGALATVRIRYGKLDAFNAYLKEQGYGGLFDYYQRDFGTIEGSISGYERISQMVLMVGLALWLLILALFMLLFPAQEGKNLNRMWALGAEKKQLMGHVLLSGGSILLPGAALGFIGSALVAEKFGQIVAQLAKSEEPLKISISSLAAASTVSFLVQLLILAIIAFFMSRKRREDY